MTQFFKMTATITIAMICIALNSEAQMILCKDRDVKVKSFVADSMASFNSRYVKYGAVKNIKESVFPLEIRIFSTWISSEIIDLKTIQSTKDSVIFKQERIWITPKGPIPNYKKIYDGGKFQVNMAAQPVKRNVNIYSDFFQNLRDNNLFTVKGEENGENFINTEDYTKSDAGGNYWIEVKIGKKVRNFFYFFSAGLNDRNSMRQAEMKKLIELINDKFSKK